MITLTICGSPPSAVQEKRLQQVIHSVFLVTRRKSRGSVGIRFVSEAEMRALNATYRGKRTSTDVLSFAPAHLPGMMSSPQKEWGDICIDSRYVLAEAKRRSIPLVEEVLRVTAHGMLHLLGYDHATNAEEMRMFALQERAVERVFYTV